MTYEIYRYIFIGGAVLAGVMLAVSVLLFFLLNIPHVIGDLTGRTAKKAIEEIRNQNELSGDKTYKTSAVNRERGKLTAKISPSGRLEHNTSGGLHGAMPTSKISTEELPPAFAETAVLDSGNETTVLDSGNETTVLNQDSGETTVLSATDTPVFQIEYEITYVHTDEVIA